VTATARPNRTAAAVQARRSVAAAMIERVRDALRQMQREHTEVTVAGVARRASVSRTFLYQNPAARQLVSEFVIEMVDRRAERQSEHAKQIAVSWRERALNAEDQLNCVHREIRMQRNTIGELLGKIRDLEADLPEDGVQRLITENTTLKHRNRELTTEVKRCQDRLQAARENNRFLDNRIAGLESQLLEEPLA
jgi:Family of unknown function (DUF6262)